MSAASSKPPLKSVVLVGLMGSGKSSVGRRLAKRLNLPFIDADQEIAAAAGCSIEEIFERYGESAFRNGERRVIARLLDEGAKVLATGGGAFIDAGTRDKVRETGVSVWLRAELDILVNRVGRRGGRPLLKDVDPRQKLGELIAERYPIYALADITVETGEEPPDTTVDTIVAALEAHERRTPVAAKS